MKQIEKERKTKVTGMTPTNKQPWELGKKYDSNFIFTFAVVKVRYGRITTAKIFKHGNYLK